VFGGEMKKDFLFAPGWTNLNHGPYHSSLAYTWPSC
jgi:hypothetical protein